MQSFLPLSLHVLLHFVVAPVFGQIVLNLLHQGLLFSLHSLFFEKMLLLLELKNSPQVLGVNRDFAIPGGKSILFEFLRAAPDLFLLESKANLGLASLILVALERWLLSPDFGAPSICF